MEIIYGQLSSMKIIYGQLSSMKIIHGSYGKLWQLILRYL